MGFFRRNGYTIVLAVAGLFQTACGVGPSALSSGNGGSIDGQGVKHEYQTVYSAIGSSTEIVVGEHFVTVVTLGQTMEQSSFSSESFDINNGLDLVVPEFLEARQGN